MERLDRSGPKTPSLRDRYEDVVGEAVQDCVARGFGYGSLVDLAIESATAAALAVRQADAAPPREALEWALSWVLSGNDLWLEYVEDEDILTDEQVRDAVRDAVDNVWYGYEVDEFIERHVGPIQIVASSACEFSGDSQAICVIVRGEQYTTFLRDVPLADFSYEMNGLGEVRSDPDFVLLSRDYAESCGGWLPCNSFTAPEKYEEHLKLVTLLNRGPAFDEEAAAVWDVGQLSGTTPEAVGAYFAPELARRTGQSTAAAEGILREALPRFAVASDGALCDVLWEAWKCLTEWPGALSRPWDDNDGRPASALPSPGAPGVGRRVT